jgi:hypothetical protein
MKRNSFGSRDTNRQKAANGRLLVKGVIEAAENYHSAAGYQPGVEGKELRPRKIAQRLVVENQMRDAEQRSRIGRQLGQCEGNQTIRQSGT